MRQEIGSTQIQELEKSEEAFGEDYYLDGVQCQVLYTTIGAWEQEMKSVLGESNTSAIAQKAMEGLLRGIPLHGADVIQRWQERARSYPFTCARGLL